MMLTSPLPLIASRPRLPLSASRPKLPAATHPFLAADPRPASDSCQIAIFISTLATQPHPQRHPISPGAALSLSARTRPLHTTKYPLCSTPSHLHTLTPSSEPQFPSTFPNHHTYHHHLKTTSAHLAPHCLSLQHTPFQPPPPQRPCPCSWPDQTSTLPSTQPSTPAKYTTLPPQKVRYKHQLLTWRSTVSVCTHTPSTQSTTTRAPSVMRRAAVTSELKST